KRASALETMTAILHDEPPELAGSGKTVPLELERLIRHCLEKNPESRLHSAHDLAYDLRALLGDSGLSKAPPSRQRFRPGVWVSFAAGLLLLIGGFLFIRPLLDTSATPNATAVSPAGLDTLAILPFTNASTEPEAGYLGDDIT